MVQVKTALVPAGIADTVDAANDVFAIEAVPLKTLHVPTPTNAVFPANVKEPELQLD